MYVNIFSQKKGLGGWLFASLSHLTTKDVYTQCSGLILVGIEACIAIDTSTTAKLLSTYLVPKGLFCLPHILFLEEWPIFASEPALSKRSYYRPWTCSLAQCGKNLPIDK